MVHDVISPYVFVVICDPNSSTSPTSHTIMQGTSHSWCSKTQYNAKAQAQAQEKAYSQTTFFLIYVFLHEH